MLRRSSRGGGGERRVKMGVAEGRGEGWASEGASWACDSDLGGGGAGWAPGPRGGAQGSGGLKTWEGPRQSLGLQLLGPMGSWKQLRVSGGEVPERRTLGLGAWH